jgi:hypothetical protein
MEPDEYDSGNSWVQNSTAIMGISTLMQFHGKRNMKFLIACNREFLTFSNFLAGDADRVAGEQGMYYELYRTGFQE